MSAGFDLAEGGRLRHAARQLRAGRAEIAACTSWAAASMLRSRSNWRVMLVSPGCDRRGHRVDAGDGGELVLQRRGDRRRHGVRIGAGQAGADLDGGEIDVGQFADRQAEIAEDAEDHQRRHDQRGHHRTLDEDARDIHGLASSARSAAGLARLPRAPAAGHLALAAAGRLRAP